MGGSFSYLLYRWASPFQISYTYHGCVWHSGLFTNSIHSHEFDHPVLSLANTGGDKSGHNPSAIDGAIHATGLLDRYIVQLAWSCFYGLVFGLVLSLDI
jgi:hypothetical protein